MPKAKDPTYKPNKQEMEEYEKEEAEYKKKLRAQAEKKQRNKRELQKLTEEADKNDQAISQGAAHGTEESTFVNSNRITLKQFVSGTGLFETIKSSQNAMKQGLKIGAAITLLYSIQFTLMFLGNATIPSYQKRISS